MKTLAFHPKPCGATDFVSESRKLHRFVLCAKHRLFKASHAIAPVLVLWPNSSRRIA